ncbi:hypothetical protein [Pandoraea fibrosis]|uniref:Uncharacterized protein n=1 Tax=Pandoraea fibrosis TaxID=1891094 RepID=A0A5E4SKJ3_9BURK|nr:hypothetical protein [Pandoraea fibrosis]VVD76197.1 hypothetical protein PFI31113_00862 [Pandoraea fibrosis]
MSLISINAYRQNAMGNCSVNKDLLSQDQSKLKGDMVSVQRAVAKFDKLIFEAEGKIQREFSRLSEIAGLSQCNDDKFIVRLKNGHFKVGCGGDGVKSILFQRRYKLECKEAAMNLGCSKGEINVADAKLMIKNKINGLVDAIYDLESKKRDAWRIGGKLA